MGQVIRITAESVRRTGRSTEGVRLMNMADDDLVVRGGLGGRVRRTPRRTTRRPAAGPPVAADAPDADDALGSRGRWPTAPARARRRRPAARAAAGAEGGPGLAGRGRAAARRREADRRRQPPACRGAGGFWWILLALLALNWFIVSLIPDRESRLDVPYTLFREQVEAGNVAEVTSQGDTIQGEFKKAVTYPADSDDDATRDVRDDAAGLRRRRAARSC